MRKNDKGAQALREKLQELTKPEKELALAFVKGVEAGAAIKDGRTCEHCAERVTASGNRMVEDEWLAENSLPQSPCGDSSLIRGSRKRTLPEENQSNAISGQVGTLPAQPTPCGFAKLRSCTRLISSKENPAI